MNSKVRVFKPMALLIMQIIFLSALYVICLNKGTPNICIQYSSINIHNTQNSASLFSPQYSNVNDLKKADVKSGSTIHTKGFYSENDGGAAEYIISSSPTQLSIPNISIPLDNGLFANLIYSDSINVKQIGARGNGTDNDFGYINSIINSGNNVEFPDGTYNMGFNDLHCPATVTFKGSKNKSTVLMNTTVFAPKGIAASDITFDGGNKQSIYIAGRPNFEGSFLIITTPSGATSVEYTNCSFKNADYASFAMENKNNSENYFTSDKITDCAFFNIKRIGVYHCVDSLLSVYNGNSFSNIGDSSVTEGTLAALKIGDTTNNTTIGSKDCTITNNTFSNLYSGDDYTYSKHSLACNFITVFGEKAKIKSNKFYNLYGYGDDREAIYTKVRQCTISNNYILNGGFGEGYICCKGYPVDDFYSDISSNTLEGDYGTGIKCYGDATICNNNINISHCMRGISCNGSDVITKNDLTIDSNRITTTVSYFYNGSQKMDSYTPKYMIQAETYGTPVTISNNTISVESANSTPLQSMIRIGSIKNNCTIDHNNLNSTVAGCGGIEATAREEFQDYNKNCTITITSNIIKTESTPIAFALKGNLDNTNRRFVITDNDMTCTSNSNYFVLISDSANNNDTLSFSNNKTNTTAPEKTLSSNVHTLQ